MKIEIVGKNEGIVSLFTVEIEKPSTIKIKDNKSKDHYYLILDNGTIRKARGKTITLMNVLLESFKKKTI